MPYIKLSLLFISLTLYVSIAYSADDQSCLSKNYTLDFDYSSQLRESTLDLTGYTVCAVPGQNGLGSSRQYVAQILGVSPDIVEQVTTPLGSINSPDLGQSVCIKHLKSAIDQKDNVIIHATSQGTATTLNYCAMLSAAEQSKIKAIILEAVLASGNSAIMHTVTGPLMGWNSVESAPGSRYVVPYAAKAVYPRYWPAGKQPIKSIADICSDVPIIIMHSKKDQQLSFKDAQALYYGLRSHGNNNVYFVPFEGYDHISICDRHPEKKELVKKILRTQLDLAGEKLTSEEKQQYQPDPKALRKTYEDLLTQEQNHETIGYVSAAASTALVGASLYYRSCSIL
ncbi:MAG: hypothetical protein WD055_01395 [Candidatus Dependentiae bacterium]